jgi:hypothetical protein
VEQLIADGVGKPFTPAGRTFREWVLIDDRDETRWAELIDQARTPVFRQVTWPICGRGFGPRWW